MSLPETHSIELDDGGVVPFGVLCAAFSHRKRSTTADKLDSPKSVLLGKYEREREGGKIAELPSWRQIERHFA